MTETTSLQPSSDIASAEGGKGADVLNLRRDLTLSREELSADTQVVAQFIFWFAIITSVVMLCYAASRWQSCATPLIWSSALFTVGMLLGFLFAIPKVLQLPPAGGRQQPTPDGGVKPRDNPEAAPPYQQRVNTNLEEISDWLTKIIVGITLVEFNNIRPYVAKAAALIGSSFKDAPDQLSFGYAVLVFYSSIGFLFGYLTTRLYIQRAFAKAEGAARETPRGVLTTLKSLTGIGTGAGGRTEPHGMSLGTSVKSSAPALAAPASAEGAQPQGGTQAAGGSHFRLSELAFQPKGILADMDPQLQRAVALVRSGVQRVATSTTGADELPVVAKVSDTNAWFALSEVRAGAMISKAEGENSIVTGRIPVTRIESVRGQPFVVSLKAARVVRPTLSATTEETACRADLLPTAVQPDGGKGVVVGIVDFGCDFVHRNFRDKEGKTRLEAIWHQAGATPATAQPSISYGRLYKDSDINTALAQPDPYSTLGYGPDVDSPTDPGAHGTHVMDIAAGSGGGSGVSGCAPAATLIFVDLSADNTPWTGRDAIDKKFSDSVQLLEAVKFVFDSAGNRPCVVNLSLGTNGGPHDGTSLVEQGLDALIREAPNRAVVISASNSYADGIHASGTVPAGGSKDLTWITTGNREPAELEVWLPASSLVAVELVAPDGTSLAVVEPGGNKQLQDDERVVIVIANRRKDPGNGDNNIGIYLADAFQAGQWTVKLHSRDGTVAPFHSWIERYDRKQSTFADPAPGYTLGSISCGHETVVVGSYDAHKPAHGLSWFSSEGPTRDGRRKPEISAPGHDVNAAWSRTGDKVIRKSGTSMAAPAVTGIIALLFAESIHKSGPPLTSAKVKALLTLHANRVPPPGASGTWHSRYGFGRINCAATIPHV